MKRVLLAILVIGLLLMAACGAPARMPIPTDVLNQIQSLADDEPVSKYVSVLSVEDEGGYLQIHLEIPYNPELIYDLEDAFKQAEIWTGAIAQNTVKLLKTSNVDIDVSVWARLPLGEGKVALLGNTWYSEAQGTYKWERYKP